MSSQLTNLVPIFDRQNYGQWAKAIKVFLMSQGLWGYTDGSIAQPAPGTPAEEAATWKRASDMARGNIVLRLTPAVQQASEEAATVVDLWNALHIGYGSPMATTVYKDLKEALCASLPRLSKVRDEARTAGDTLRGCRWACARPRTLVLITSVYCIRKRQARKRRGRGVKT